MTFDSSAWAIDGPQIPSAQARRALFASTSGNEGITRPNDLKVTATSPASGTVQIASGSAIVLNSSGGGDGQSYGVHNTGQATLDVNPTGGASRSDLVIIQVQDPEFSPWEPPPAGEEDTYQYVAPVVIYDVPSGTTNADQLDLGYSAYALARIDRPSGTGIVTDAQIVDLRNIAQPRISIQAQNVACTGTDLLNIMPPFTWEHFPDTAHFTVDIPSWATKAIVQGFVEGLAVNHQGVGALSLQINGNRSQLTNIATDDGQTRADFNLGGIIDIPSDIRGTTQTIFLEGRLGNTDSAGMLQCVDSQTNFQATVMFTEGVQ